MPQRKTEKAPHRSTRAHRRTPGFSNAHRGGSRRSHQRISSASAGILALVAALAGALGGMPACAGPFPSTGAQQTYQSSSLRSSNSDSVVNAPAYAGDPWCALDADGTHPTGTPDFSAAEIRDAGQGSYLRFSELDSLGRCGVAQACLGTDTLATKKRGSIRSVYPTGWHQQRYSFIDDGALYNRCHLIAHSLSGEDANERNLVTGTRAMNTQGMEPFEAEVLSYIRTTGNHVLYRVTPLFQSSELVCRGVQMEARSLEDDGAGVCFNVYCYNVQDGVEIDYATGCNRAV